MTVIAAQKNADGTISFASDSQVSAGWSRVSPNQTTTCKLVHVNSVTFGSTGYLAESQLMRSFLKTHKPATAEELAISELMFEFLEWCKRKDSEYKLRNSFLIAFDNKLFRVDKMLDVFEVPRFDAIGCGQDYAIAAMHLGHSPRKAVKVACQISVYCQGPILTHEHQPLAAT